MTTGSNEWQGVALSHGRYVLAAKLGEGGMGYVYQARDRNLDADVVIKVPRQSMMEDPDFAGRFARETRSLVALSHPGIVKITDVGDWDGLPFAVMQFLPGGSLEDRLASATDERAGLEGPGRVTVWLTGVAAALDYVHSQGYIHRDVKPGNILFDAQGHPFLSDFGVAKVMALSGETKSSKTAMTGAGMVLGTPEYMAPELIMGEPFDGRVDQYALAVTVYETLCGRRPFEDDSKTKVLVLHTTKPVPALTAHRPEFGERLNEAVLKGLAKDPSDRYPTCAAMAAAITSAAKAERAARDDRVRIKCSTCGRSLAMASAEYAKLAQAGKQFPCPACNAPLSPTMETLREAPPRTESQRPVRSGTVAVTTQPAPPSPPTTPMREPSSRTPGPQRRPAATVVERRPAATVVERRPAATVVERTPQRTQLIDVNRDDADEDLDDSPAAGKNPVAIWIVVGACAVLSLVILGVAMRGRGAASPSEVAATGPAVAPAPAATGPATATAPPVSTPADESEPIPAPVAAELPKAPPPVAANDVPGRPAAMPGAEAETAPPKIQVSNVERVEAKTALTELASTASPTGPGNTLSAVPEPPPVSPPPSEPDEPVPTPPAPGRMPKVELDKLLASPGRYDGQFVELTKLYCLADVPLAQPDGSVTIPVIESALHFVGNAPQVRRFAQGELGLDRKLANRLVAAGKLSSTRDPAPTAPNWSDDVAVLTLRVTERKGEKRQTYAVNVVRIEYLTRFETERVRKGFKKGGALKFVFHTTTFSPDGEKSGQGNPDEWKQTNRLGHIANQLQKSFNSLSRAQSDAEWNRFNAQLEAVTAQSVRAAARQSAAFEAEQARMMRNGRP